MKKFNEKKFYEELEVDTINFYLNPDKNTIEINEILYKGAHVKDEKYFDKNYLRKISPNNYPIFIYENFQKHSNFKHKLCKIENRMLFDLNGKAFINSNNERSIILDLCLSPCLQLISTAFFTYVFNNEFHYSEECKDFTDLYHLFIYPMGQSFFNIYKVHEFQELLDGLKSLTSIPNADHIIVSDGTNYANAMLFFIICHEQAHHELNHTTSNVFDNKSSISNILKKEIQQRELDADRLALKLFLECDDKNSDFNLFKNLNEKHCTPFLLFNILSGIEWIQGRKEEDMLYPSGKKRYENLLREIPEIDYKQIDGFNEAWNDFMDIFKDEETQKYANDELRERYKD